MSLGDIFRRNSDQLKQENLMLNGQIRYHEQEIKEKEEQRNENLRELARMDEF